MISDIIVDRLVEQFLSLHGREGDEEFLDMEAYRRNIATEKIARRFDGKYFSLHSNSLSKSNLELEAAELKRCGYEIRIQSEKVGTHTDFNLWVRDPSWRI